LPELERRLTIERDDGLASLPALLAVVARVRAEGGDYPPTRVESNVAAYANWLTEGATIARWVGRIGDTVVGHILLAKPGDYLDEFLSPLTSGSPFDSFVEIGRLFVDPVARGRGVGRGLLAAATSEAEDRHLLPVLVVRDTEERAVRLYRAEGWREAGSLPSARGGYFRIFLHGR
jgi:GNAT superfamily N-acetyltransferase